MAQRATPAKQEHDESGALIGAQGEPLSAYPGWDADEGVFRLDCPIADLEERYRRIAEELETGDASEATRDDDGAPKDPAQPPRVATRSVST